MSNAYRPKHIVERYVNGAWEDISEYTTSEIAMELGFRSQRPDDRTASVGTCKFEITGPLEADADFPHNMPIRIRVNAGEIVKTFMFYVDQAVAPTTTVGKQSIQIKCHDWLGIALETNITSIAVSQGILSSTAINTLVASSPIPPTSSSIQTGTEKFPIAHDLIEPSKTTIYEEINRVTLSEWGLAYMKNSGQFRFENCFSRDEATIFSPFNVTFVTGNSNIGILKVPSGDTIWLPSSKDEVKIMATTSQTISFDGDLEHFLGSEITTGENIINDITFTVQPRQVDSTAGNSVLYTYNLYEDNPFIPINTGETIYLRGKYPEQVGSKIPSSALSVVTPTPNTGNSFFYFGVPLDSTGSTFEDLSANLTRTFVAGGGGWTWQITNNGPLGYILHITLAGKAIFNSQPLYHNREDTISQGLWGKRTLDVRQPYVQSITRAKLISNTILSVETSPRLEIKKVDLIANYSLHEMAAFIYSDIGNLRTVKMVVPNISKLCFIQGMNIKLRQDGIIHYSLTLAESLLGHQPLALHYSGVLNSKNLVTFPSSSANVNNSARTVSFWVFIQTIRDASMVNQYDGLRGWDFHMIDGIQLMQFRQGFTVTDGIWRTPTNSLNSLVNGWHHIAVTYNRTSVNNNPVIYFDASSQTLTELLTPEGTAIAGDWLPIRIGNTDYSGYSKPSRFDGLLKDIRIYNRALSSGEITTLSDNENDYTTVSSGLVFQALQVPSSTYPGYWNAPIYPLMFLYDRASGFTGNAEWDSSITNGALKGADPTLNSYS